MSVMAGKVANLMADTGGVACAGVIERKLDTG